MVDQLTIPPKFPIIAFYSGAEPDHQGRYLHEIHRWSDEQLESVHDYIQWLFPLPEPSGFNPTAPILTRESVRDFRTRPELQQKLRISFLRMLKFYGLEIHSSERPNVTRSSAFAARATVWLSAGNHNHLRITRILKSVRLLGLELEAKAFFECLAEIYSDEESKPLPAISEETFLFWQEAVGEAGS